MPAKPPAVSTIVAEQLAALGDRIRAQRKALGVSAVAAAQAAGMSRVTWHRIEKGEPAVTMGAYLQAMAVVSLPFGVLPDAEPARATRARPSPEKGWLPVRIRLTDYPELKRLAWHVRGSKTLTPLEAAGLYAAHERHLDMAALQPQERALLAALREAFPNGTPAGH